MPINETHPENEPLHAKIPATEFVDAAVLFSAVVAFQAHLKGDMAVVPDGEQVKHYIRGVHILRNLLPKLDVGLREYGNEIADAVRAGTRFRSGLTSKVIFPEDYTADAPVAMKRYMAMNSVFPIALRKGGLLSHIMPDNRSEGAMIRFARAMTQHENPTAYLNALARLPMVSPIGAKGAVWIDLAAKYAGVPVSDVDASTRDAETAKHLGEDLRITDAKLGVADPGDPVQAELALTRADTASTLSSIAENSPSPEVVKTAAAVEATRTGHYATEIGKQVGLSPQQEDAMLSSGKTIIAAGAGSGKTKTVAARIVHTISEVGAKPGEIIATSFSRKSAAELIKRVKDYGGKDILKGEEEGFGTTHSVAGRIVNKYGRLAGLGNIAPLSEGDTTKLMRIAMEQVKMSAAMGVKFPDPDPNEDFFHSDTTQPPPEPPPSDEDDVELFANSISEALRFFENKLQRNPDNGWYTFSRNLLSDILKRGTLPERLSDKQKAALNKALAAAGVKYIVPSTPSPARTAHIKEQMKKAKLRKKAEEEEAKGKPSKSALGAEVNYYFKNPANQWFNLGIKDLLDADGHQVGVRRFALYVSKNKGGLKAPGPLGAAALAAYKEALAVSKNKDDILPAQAAVMFAAAYAAYEWLKNHSVGGDYSGASDFDDVLINCSRVLFKSPEARGSIQRKFKHILTDESQDLNKSQHLMFGLISGSYDHETLAPRADGGMTAQTYTMIGDDKQAIYSFRGAEPGVFIENSDLRGGGFKTKILDTNYRSGSQIVEAANKLIAHNDKQIPMTCKADPRKEEGNIQAQVVDTNEAGASLLGATVEQSTKGEGATSKYSDFGVAVRTNAEAVSYGMELLKRGIPFKAKVNFFNNPTSKALLAWMHVATLPLNAVAEFNEAMMAARNCPTFYLDKTFEDRLQQIARNQNYFEYLMNGGFRRVYVGNQEWRNNSAVLPFIKAIEDVRKKHATNCSARELLDHILRLKGAPMKGVSSNMIQGLVEEVKGSPEMLDMLVQQKGGESVSDEEIEDYALSPVKPLLGIADNNQDPTACVQYVRKLQKANDKLAKKDDEEADAVVIDTVHGWKGLECDHMYTSMPAGTFPHKRSMGDPETLADERRLAYVAITRGRKSVTILCPKIDSAGRPAGPSQFVYEACIPIKGDEEDKETPQEEVTDQDKLVDKVAADLGISDTDLDAYLADNVEYFNTPGSPTKEVTP